MPRNTRTNRRSRSKLAGEYARSLLMDDMPHGGVRSTPQLQPWQYPRRKRLGNVVLANRIVQRWAVVIPASRR